MTAHSNPFVLPSGWFGRLAGWWMARSNRPLAAWAIAGLDLQPSDRLLDIGSGPGVGLDLAARRLPAGLAVGVDPSADMHRQAAKRNRRALRDGRAALGQASVSALPFADHSFQKVVSVNAIRLWPDPVSDLREVHRVMVPGARLVVVMHGHDARNGRQLQRQQRRCIEWIEQARLTPLQALSKSVRGAPALRVIALRAGADFSERATAEDRKDRYRP